MEHLPQQNGNEPPARPTLDVDLSSGDGHWFNLLSMVRAQLEGEARKEFNRTIGEVMLRGSGVTYNGLLGIITAYIDVTDTSGTFEAYTRKTAEPPQG